MFKSVDPRPDFSKLEEAILAFWEKEKVFEKSLEATAKGEPFTFYDGPPFATGLPHYGHILASTIKDVIPRYQTMQGRFVRRRWGWDCHGLPIEEIVERMLKISGKKQIEAIGIKKFNETCRQQVLTYVKEWGKMVRRMGRWIDFENSYKTMDRDYMESVWWAFKQIYDKGLVYEGRKVLLYCPRCETPISNFEVAMDNSYQDVTEEAVIVKFKVQNSKLKIANQNSKVPIYLLAWTTTPWTLIGNVALAVGKDIDYVLVEGDEENYIIARDRISVIPGLTRNPDLDSRIRGNDRKEGGDLEVIQEFKGQELVGLEYEPLYQVAEMQTDKSYQVYAGDFVNTEEGTGIVHTAVVYGEDDYSLGMKVGLPVVPLLDEKGKFRDIAPELIRGQYFKDAEKPIKKDLDARGLMFEKKMHQHSYPHCWRCDSPLYYNAIPAWFINIQKIKDRLLATNDKEINWYPEYLKYGRYQKSVEMAPDWNISRNRYWGNPIPVWKCENCGKNTVVGSIKELEEKQVKSQIPNPNGQKNGSHPAPDAGSRVLDSRLRLPRVKAGGNDRNGEEVFDLHRPYIDEVVLKCDFCGGEARRITEIFDSWVEAGSMPFSEYHYPFENQDLFKSRFPAQFVAEYIAQTRAWFYVMHVISLNLFGRAPFENVVTTGTILAEDGSKMSKSKNNYPDPWQVIEKYGVDSLRFYLMNSVVMQGDNLNFSERDLANVNRKTVRIFWNVYNYFVTYANEAGWQPTLSLISPPPRRTRGRRRGGVLDEWICARTQELVNKVTEYLDGYNTVRATREIQIYIDELSTWYLRRSRGRLDEGFFATLQHSLLTAAEVMAPFMPFIAEMVYQNLRGAEDANSVHLSAWPKSRKLAKNEQDVLEEMQKLRKLVGEIHAIRAKRGLKLRQPLAKLKIKNIKLKVELEEILKDEINVKEIQYGQTVELDTEITPELKIEGLAAELTRQIQKFRKDSGLKIGQTVDLVYDTKSANIKKALELVNRQKLYVRNLESISANQNQKVDFTKELEMEGESVVLKLKVEI